MLMMLFNGIEESAMNIFLLVLRTNFEMLISSVLLLLLVCISIIVILHNGTAFKTSAYNYVDIASIITLSISSYLSAYVIPIFLLLMIDSYQEQKKG